MEASKLESSWLLQRNAGIQPAGGNLLHHLLHIEGLATQLGGNRQIQGNEQVDGQQEGQQGTAQIHVALPLYALDARFQQRVQLGQCSLPNADATFSVSAAMLLAAPVWPSMALRNTLLFCSAWASSLASLPARLVLSAGL
jgi:hypothetical protein